MGSISVGELIDHLKSYPESYKVIMDWNWKEWDEINQKSVLKHSVADINGIACNDDYKEIRLLN